MIDLHVILNSSDFKNDLATIKSDISDLKGINDNVLHTLATVSDGLGEREVF